MNEIFGILVQQTILGPKEKYAARFDGGVGFGCGGVLLVEVINLVRVSASDDICTDRKLTVSIVKRFFWEFRNWRSPRRDPDPFCRD